MAADWLVRAVEAHKRGDHAGALRACLHVPRDRESQTRAHAIRAAALARLDRPDEALSEIEAAMRLGIDSIELYKLAVRICTGRGDLRGAREWIDRTLRQRPASRQLLELRGQIVSRMHLLTGLHDQLELTVGLLPTWTEARERLIELLLTLGLYEAAESHLELVMAQEGASPERYIRQALVAIETGRGAAAVPALDRALALSESATERARIARMLLKAGALAEARQAVQQNLARAPAAPEARLQSGFFALWQGDVRGAERLAGGLPAGTPGRAKLDAAIALVDGRHDVALAAVAEALHDDATDAEVHALRAACLFFLARYEEANQAALMAAQHTSEWLPGAQLVQFGALNVNYSDHVEVLEWLRDVVPQLPPPTAGGEPFPSQALIDAAAEGLRRLSGNFTSALTFVSEPSGVWTPLRPKVPARFACVRAAGWIQARPWDWVVERIDALAPVYPRAVYVHTHAAELWLWYGDYARCEAECRKALVLTKTRASRWAWVGLGAALMFQERYAEALDVFAESNELMQPGAPLLAYRGETLRRCGKLAAARYDLTWALELAPARVSAWLNLGRIALAEGRADEARAIAWALQAGLPEFVDDIRRDMGAIGRDVLESPSALFESSLVAMRGNRSSGRITYFLSDGEARVVSACVLTPSSSSGSPGVRS